MTARPEASKRRTGLFEGLRHVREGGRFNVSDQRVPAAETYSVQRESATVEARLNDLERRGVLVDSGTPRTPLAGVDRRPGAVDRFLAERDE